MQYRTAKEKLREKELKMKKDHVIRMLHNKRLIEILYKMGYDLEDSFECYEFLKEDLSNEGEVKQTLGPLFALNQEKAGQAFLKQVSLLKNMNKLKKTTNIVS